MGEAENWDIHDIDLEILRMKNVLEEEMNDNARLKKRIEILEERIAWSPGGAKQEPQRKWQLNEEYKE